MEIILLIAFTIFSILVSAYDILCRKIPNMILLAFLPAFLLIRIVHHSLPFYQYLYGFLLGFIVLLVLALLTRKLGMGDVKLFAVIGLITGWQAALGGLYLAGIIVIVQALCVSLYRRKWIQSLPFGPALCIGGLISYLW